MREIKNAKIKRVRLGYDRGVFLCAWLHLDYGGAGQGFGGFVLNQYDKDSEKRIGTAWGTQYIQEILRVVGVDSWEDLPGKHIRVDSEHSKVHGIGNILKDEWFYPAKDLDWLKDEEGLIR